MQENGPPPPPPPPRPPPSLPATYEEADFSKYDKMLKMLPEGAVRQKMMIDNISEGTIDAYFAGMEKKIPSPVHEAPKIPPNTPALPPAPPLPSRPPSARVPPPPATEDAPPPLPTAKCPPPLPARRPSTKPTPAAPTAQPAAPVANTRAAGVRARLAAMGMGTEAGKPPAPAPAPTPTPQLKEGPEKGRRTSLQRERRLSLQEKRLSAKLLVDAVKDTLGGEEPTPSSSGGVNVKSVQEKFKEVVATKNEAGAGVTIAKEAKGASVMPSKFKQKYFEESGRRRIMELFEEAGGQILFDQEEQLVQEGELVKYNRRNEPETKSYILTSVKFIYGKREGHKFKVDSSIPLAHMVLRFPLGEERKGSSGRYTFLIMSAKKSFHAMASVPEGFPVKVETDELYKNIRDVAHKAQVKTHGQPLKDDTFVMWAVRSGVEATSCSRCELPFTLFLRRHHCR